MSRVQIQDKIELNSGFEADFPFDVDEALRTGTFISGMSGSVKTNVAKLCVQRLLSNNVRVFVFDPSKAWMWISARSTTLKTSYDPLILLNPVS